MSAPLAVRVPGSAHGFTRDQIDLLKRSGEKKAPELLPSGRTPEYQARIDAMKVHLRAAQNAGTLRSYARACEELAGDDEDVASELREVWRGRLDDLRVLNDEGQG